MSRGSCISPMDNENSEMFGIGWPGKIDNLKQPNMPRFAGKLAPARIPVKIQQTISRRPPVSSQEQSTLEQFLIPLHPEGWRFVAIFALATLVLFWLWAPLGWIGVVLTVWCACFFRDPPRVTPAREGLVISPADGVVQMIVQAPPP